MPTQATDRSSTLEDINRRLVQAYEVIEMSNVVVFEWTLDVNLPALFVTDNISQFGYGPDDFYSGELKDYWQFVYPEDREAARSRVYEHREQRAQRYHHQYRVVCKDGSIRWVEESVMLEYDDNGDSVRERGMLYDITERVVLMEKMKISEERYRTLFDRAPAIMMTMDAEGRITSANRHCQEFFEYDEEHLTRMRFKDLIVDQTASMALLSDPLGFIKSMPETTLDVEVKTKSLRTRNIQVKLDAVYFGEESPEIQLVAQDVTNKKVVEERARFLSYHDKLTGLFNRAWFDEQMHQIEGQSEYPYTVIIGDMNGLKVANDLFGHKVGDSLLTVVAEILRKCCRETDVICRLGGDEFAILLPKANEEAARDICRRIRTACDDARMKPLNPSIALGYATRHDADMPVEDLMKEADDRMYRNKLNVSNSLRSSLILSLQASLEEKTLETKEHAERIRALSIKLGHRMGLPESLMDELSLASMMHDIGKVGIPDSILMKPGKLNLEEWEIMKKHCEIGRNIVRTSTNMDAVGKYILHHHERYDGTGYPYGLSGEDIPLVSRIIAVVDTYDVMTHVRPYKSPMPHDEVCLEMLRCRGSQFCPKVLDAFLEMIDSDVLPEFNVDQSEIK